MRAALAEYAALKQKVVQLRAERDILKNGEPRCTTHSSTMASAFLAREAT